MAATPQALTVKAPLAFEPQLTTVDNPVAAEPPSQPLWRFAMIGLSPLTLLLLFALVVDLSRRLG